MKRQLTATCDYYFGRALKRFRSLLHRFPEAVAAESNYLGCCNQICSDPRPAEWLAEVCSAMEREARQVLQPLISDSSQVENTPPRNSRAAGYSRRANKQSIVKTR